MVLESAAKIATELLAPINKVCDHPGAQHVDGQVVMPDEIKKVYNDFSEGMWNGVTMSTDYAGLGLPMVLNIAANEFFMGASTGFHLTSQLTAAAAGVIYDFYEGPHKQPILENMSMGVWAGTMNLTEPSAGSDVGALKSTAKKLDNGAYLVSGPKIFISAGDQDMTENIIHLVLARVEGAPAGPKGISLFVVPKYKLADDGTTTDQSNDVGLRAHRREDGHPRQPDLPALLRRQRRLRRLDRRRGEPGPALHVQDDERRARSTVGVQGVCCGLGLLPGSAGTTPRSGLQFTSLKEYKNPAAPRCAIIEHPDVRRMADVHEDVRRGGCARCC